MCIFRVAMSDLAVGYVDDDDLYLRHQQSWWLSSLGRCCHNSDALRADESL